mmetsp:Transcript_73595/g.117040  ORF Transcript_73595/g.117040 Transcript_73595/m.117040 type:complete len:211 (-) Transcript_73595:628-1260(-)
MVSYSSFLSFSKDSCFRKAPIKRSTSAWISSSSFRCRPMSSSCSLALFSSSFLVTSKGGKVSSTLSLCDKVCRYRRLTRSNCFWCVVTSCCACRFCALRSSRSLSKTLRFPTKVSWVTSSFCIFFFRSSQCWSLILELSVISWSRICFLALDSSISLASLLTSQAWSFAAWIAATFSFCASCRARTAFSNFSACFWMRSGSSLILLSSES